MRKVRTRKKENADTSSRDIGNECVRRVEVKHGMLLREMVFKVPGRDLMHVSPIRR
jgi:hypothetical protein